MIIMLALGFGAASLAADNVPASPTLGAQAEKLIKENLPVCSVAQKVSRAELKHKLPANMVASVVRIESERNACAGQWVAIVTNEGDFFMGVPWFLEDSEGTLEDRLKAFGWKQMNQGLTPIIDRTKTRDGLFKASVAQTTEVGPMPLLGEIDPNGSVFFIGRFIPLNSDIRNERLKAFEPYLSKSPVTGAKNPVVTVIEFSDFECPSCQRAAGYMKPLLEKYGDKLRYVRYDLPLVSMHPWAFSAAVAGRAVYNQKPDLFWKYKEFVYENQEKLNAFTIDDKLRGWAQDHELDLKRYDADVNDTELRKSILTGAGVAFSNDVRATPTYVINGVTVDAGDGKALEAYVAGLLKK